MSENLYPLKFHPILKDKIWGGKKLASILHKEKAGEKCGESWEISGYQNNISIVKNGFLAGNNLQEIIEIYMGEIVGDHVYEKFGDDFPLLLKFIDANDKLSIQVHPDDDLAKKQHNDFGKTEMWYIIDAEENSELISGFNRELTQVEYLEYFNNNKLEELLNFFKVSPGEVYFLPAGRIHAICEGILLAEIQQTSDLTYRIYDWDRVDDQGNSRELHTDLALKAMDYKQYDNYKTNFPTNKNEFNKVIECPYFTTNYLNFNNIIQKDYYALDSFVIYMCIKGDIIINFGDSEEPETLKKGETILIPSSISNIKLEPLSESEILEIYII